MNSEFTLVWSFRNRLDVFKESILTAHNHCPESINFCLVDGSSNDETITELRAFINSIDGRKIRVCESAYRTTLPEAWNLGIMLSDTRYVAFASSDVIFYTDNWYKGLTARFKEGYEYVLIENHAVFGIDKQCLDRLGWFDEQFKNGPHFDVDYMIRASEKKIKFGILPNESYRHGDTDEVSVQRSLHGLKDRLPMNMMENEEYFKAKWQTTWPGWKDHLDKPHKPHPPTSITEVTRLAGEIDPHPLYTKKWTH